MSPTTQYAQQLQSITYILFRLFRVRSPLLSESFGYFLFVLLLRCFSSQAFLPTEYGFFCRFSGFNLKGFPHSEFCGSRSFSNSPQLIAALHVLLRLSMPRHPPLALCSFTYHTTPLLAPVEFTRVNSYVAIIVFTCSSHSRVPTP